MAVSTSKLLAKIAIPPDPVKLNTRQISPTHDPSVDVMHNMNNHLPYKFLQQMQHISAEHNKDPRQVSK